MPRFLLDARSGVGPPADIHSASRGVRFPEIEVEHGFWVRDEHGNRCVLVVRAPSEEHLDRWAQVAGLRLPSRARIDHEINQTQSLSNGEDT